MLDDSPSDADGSESRTSRAKTKFDVLEPVEELLGQEADAVERLRGMLKPAISDCQIPDVDDSAPDSEKKCAAR